MGVYHEHAQKKDKKVHMTSILSISQLDKLLEEKKSTNNNAPFGDYKFIPHFTRKPLFSDAAIREYLEYNSHYESEDNPTTNNVYISLVYKFEAFATGRPALYEGKLVKAFPQAMLAGLEAPIVDALITATRHELFDRLVGKYKEIGNIVDMTNASTQAVHRPANFKGHVHGVPSGNAQRFKDVYLDEGVLSDDLSDNLSTTL